MDQEQNSADEHQEKQISTHKGGVFGSDGWYNECF